MECSKRSSPIDDIDLDEEDRPLACPKCGAVRKGPYCHSCGQRYMKARLTAWELWWIFADRFLDWDEGVWRTFLKMATSPGVVIRRYLGGDRKTYLNPFSYLLFCAALYAGGQFLMRRVAGVTSVPGLQELQEWGAALNNAEDQFSLVAYATVLVVALMAVTMRSMFDGRLLNAMEAVVTALYASGNVFVLALFISLIELVATGSPLSTGGLIWVFAILFPFCVGHAGLGMFEEWGMAFYTAMTPIVAAIIGAGLFFIGIGVIASVDLIARDFAGGNITPLIWGISVLAGILIPAISPFLLEMYG